jgi:hypothetical protein
MSNHPLLSNVVFFCSGLIRFDYQKAHSGWRITLLQQALRDNHDHLAQSRTLTMKDDLTEGCASMMSSHQKEQA